MPAADTVLLPLCAGLSLLGLLIAILAGRRGNKGRMLQGIGLALAPIALYLSGLLGLVWNGVVAIVRWASGVILSPPVWAGLSLLALCVVLWVVGGFVARRSARRTKAQRTTPPATSTSTSTAVTRRTGAAPASRQPVEQDDDDMAEIEALLKSRGIE
ncbi:MAG: hypothetical protein ACJ72K_06175 [Friedmanniella sp.]